MAAHEEPNPFKLSDDGATDRWVSCAVYFIGAVVVTLVVLIVLNEALGRPGCTMKFQTVAPSTQPK
jgi:hypothetical protein